MLMNIFTMLSRSRDSIKLIAITIVLFAYRAVLFIIIINVITLDDDKIARISGFCQVEEMDFHHLARPCSVPVYCIPA